MGITNEELADDIAFGAKGITKAFEALVVPALSNLEGVTQVKGRPGTGANYLRTSVRGQSHNDFYLVTPRRIGSKESLSILADPRSVERMEKFLALPENAGAKMALAFTYVDARQGLGTPDELVAVCLSSETVAKLLAANSRSLAVSQAGGYRLTVHMGTFEEIERAGGHFLQYNIIY